ncbi:hypothetical protein FXN63_12710 [Pigmentiphaga aceris]|uniref:TOTE conflict systems S1/CSD-like domain-containing protein n=1 Tax=Pigmentiphaga aceris TaxID=1940612 RepID=A0A5C0B1S7_9BURK|nr:hypothetical protein [Pigmentiphaga aceris]QEI06597.1 hypothetical protein FXN63_12710 [Pigmentiphaga aceris]
MGAKEIFALRKQQRIADALEQARTEYPANVGDVWFLRAYAWALYDHAKEVVEAYEKKQLSPAALSARFTPWMREFAKIGGPLRKDSAFSQMLRLTGKVSRDWPEFLGFARWAGLDDFSDEDKLAFVNEQGKTTDSLQKRFTRAIAREAAEGALAAGIDKTAVEWGLSTLEQALRDDPNDQWLNYYRSKLHLAHGESALAIKRLAPVLRRQSRAAWPWGLLGEILEAERPVDALTCCAHAVSLAREEQEVAKLRIHLATRLSLASRFAEAAEQAKLALTYREQHGYKVPPALAQLIASDWYQEALASGQMQVLAKVDAAAKALLEELDAQTLSYSPGVIDHINVDKALSYVATGVDTGYGLLHRKFPKVAGLTPGTIVEVGIAAPDGPPLDWKLSASQAIRGLCETLSGSLERREGKGFAFIRTAGEAVFVPPALAEGFAPGRPYAVDCLAIRRTNKEGKTGWRAVSVIEIADRLADAG